MRLTRHAIERIVQRIWVEWNEAEIIGQEIVRLITKGKASKVGYKITEGGQVYRCIVRGKRVYPIVVDDVIVTVLSETEIRKTKNITRGRKHDKRYIWEY
jgi:ribosomal protein S28E/S33